jgi:photosystem II stability/assembly factor-like uncharacterized protein
MRAYIFFLCCTLSSVVQAQTLYPCTNSVSKASFRGINAVDQQVCWFSGSEGTVLRTVNGGLNFEVCSPKGYDSLQFRDIHAFGKDTALILSAGLPAVVLKTTDGGKHWRETYRNEQEGIFFDGMDFWDHQQGLAFSDAPNNKIVVLKTVDQGDHWTLLDTSLHPAVAEKQGGFAASGSSICCFDKEKAAIGLGGASATLLTTTDGGMHWTKQTLPIDAGTPAAGIFSLSFLDKQKGIAVGGNYLGDSLSTQSAAITVDGGNTWIPLTDPNISGRYRSCVRFVDSKRIVATSRTGISLSANGGGIWQSLPGVYYAVSIGKDQSIWLSGANGQLAKLKW